MQAVVPLSLTPGYALGKLWWLVCSHASYKAQFAISTSVSHARIHVLHYGEGALDACAVLGLGLLSPTGG